jgi:hypothetical protein
VSATNAGSLRTPRCGSGARKGASVSTSVRSIGTAFADSRTFSPFGKVRIPLKETWKPSARYARACAGSPV